MVKMVPCLASSFVGAFGSQLVSLAYSASIQRMSSGQQASSMSSASSFKSGELAAASLPFQRATAASRLCVDVVFMFYLGWVIAWGLLFG